MKNCFLFYIIITISVLSCKRKSTIPEEMNEAFVGYYKSQAGASSGTNLELKKDGTYFLVQRIYHSCDAFLQYTGKWTSSDNQVFLQESVPLGEYLSIVNYSITGNIDTIQPWEAATGFADMTPKEEEEETGDIILPIDEIEQEVFRTADILKKQSDTLIINLSDEVIEALPELKFWIDTDTSIFKIKKNQILVDKAKYIRQHDERYASLNESIENYRKHYYDLNFQSGNYYTSIDHVFPYDSIQISLKSPLPKPSKLPRAIVYYQKDSLLVTESGEFVMPNQLVELNDSL